jgi:catechol 2,3-dioxygenase-like lactoylglutathione lyase family enzyme
MQVEAFHHVTLPVYNLERSKEFYREILRLRAIERPPFNRPGAWFGVRPQPPPYHISGRGY